MDLESERSSLESVEDNEVVSQGTVSHVKDDKVKINGSYSDETNELGSRGKQDANSVPVYNGKLGVQSEESLAMKSPSGGSPPMMKGYGLKKWRRLKRDFVKDAGPSVDSSKVLKRGLSASVNPTTTRTHLSSVDIRQNSEASVGSVNMVKNIGVVDVFATRGSSSDSRFAVGSGFAAGTDSDNSEDQSSKSSTAASAPKSRYELPVASGYVRERNRMKNLSGKSGGNPTQRVQQGKSQMESSKKPRGVKDKIEKENSHSSMESDSRSSSFVFGQDSFGITSNGWQIGQSKSYNGEHSDDAQACEQLFGEDGQTGVTEENVGVTEDVSQDDFAADLSWDAKEVKNENHCSSTVQDPLVKSLLTLRSVQEALEKEVQKLGEVGKDAASLLGNSFKDSNVPADAASTDLEIHEPSASSSLEMQILSLTQNVQHLGTKLEEMSAMLKVKELRVAELEATLDNSKQQIEESGSSIELNPEQCREKETEREDLFRQKIEADVEYLALTSTIEKLIAGGGGGGQATLIKEQEAVADKKAETLNKLGEAESKVAVLEKQREELEKHGRDILGTEVVLKMQNRVYKVTSYFVMQFTLLVLVFWLFVSRLSPKSGMIVPT